MFGKNDGGEVIVGPVRACGLLAIYKVTSSLFTECIMMIITIM